jgi:2-C-methyl-D-erythritol 4-phosphate cytidylyltransferase
MVAKDKSDISAILAAGGKGLRFSQGENTACSKQFVQLHGRPLYIWSLLALCKESRITQIVITVPSPMIETIRNEVKALATKYGINKKIEVIAGGETRQESVFLALSALSSCVPQFVIVHDACRPFLSDAILDGVIDEVLKSGACTIAVPIYDTVKKINEGQIVETIDRQALNLVQTPQAFRFDWLFEAHKTAKDKGFEVTDDAAILEKQGHKVNVVIGSPYNVKVTNREDLAVCEALSPMFLPSSF